jgi:hypothetical protein
MPLDLNEISCGCSFPLCIKGFRFDSEPDVIIIQDYDGSDNIIHLTKKNVNQLINGLKDVKKRNKW